MKSYSQDSGKYWWQFRLSWIYLWSKFRSRLVQVSFWCVSKVMWKFKNQCKKWFFLSTLSKKKSSIPLSTENGPSIRSSAVELDTLSQVVCRPSGRPLLWSSSNFSVSQRCLCCRRWTTGHHSARLKNTRKYNKFSATRPAGTAVWWRPLVQFWWCCPLGSAVLCSSHNFRRLTKPADRGHPAGNNMNKFGCWFWEILTSGDHTREELTCCCEFEPFLFEGKLVEFSWMHTPLFKRGICPGGVRRKCSRSSEHWTISDGIALQKHAWAQTMDCGGTMDRRFSPTVEIGYCWDSVLRKSIFDDGGSL